MNLVQLNAKLPAGVKAVFVNNAIHYVVRTTFKGRRYSLGTFLSAEAAIETLVKFKVNKMIELKDSDTVDEATHIIASQVAGRPTMIETPEAKQYLQTAIEQEGPHIIGDGTKPVKLKLNGKSIMIAASIVAEAYEDLFGIPPITNEETFQQELNIEDL